MSSTELRQDTLAKRKQLSRSDAVVGDDDNKVKPSNPPSSVATSNSKEHSSTTDMMGIDVLQFIEQTLHKNAKDREFLLQIEEEFNRIVADENIQYHFFPEMTSYNRMLVHRVATYFGFIHNVDQAGKSVVVTKQKGTTKQPLVSFRSLIKHSNFTDQFPLTRRTVQSFDESIGPGHRFPPSRNFRNRNYTASGQYNNGGELNRGRRARSFETASDYWYGGPPQQFIGSGGEPMSSNCSSRASSSAIPAQIQSINLPLYQPAMLPLIGNEAGLLSPSNTSAYSEPIHPYHQPTHPIYYGLGGGKPSTEETAAEIQQLSEKEEEEGGGEENANNSNGNGQPKQSNHPHIPSLFSIQPMPPQFYAANLPQQYYPPPPPPQYQTTTYYQYQPMILSPSPVNTPTHFNFNMPAPTCYPNYYPIYQQPPNPPAIPYMQPHPLLEENNSRYLANQLNSMNLNAAAAETPQTRQQFGPSHSATESNTKEGSQSQQKDVPKQQIDKTTGKKLENNAQR